MRVMVHPRAGAAVARGHVLGPGAFSVSEKDPSCESIVVADHEIKFGSDNVVIESRNGRCRETLAVYILLYSGNGDIVGFYGNEGDERFRHLVDMTTGRSAEPPLVAESSRCAAKDDLLVVYEKNGCMTAYRPAWRPVCVQWSALRPASSSTPSLVSSPASPGWVRGVGICPYVAHVGDHMPYE